MVCGQCHVEYYCGPKTTLFFPWDGGLKVEAIDYARQGQTTLRRIVDTARLGAGG